MQASSNFAFTTDFNNHLGNSNPHMKDTEKKKSFREGTNLVENGSAAHSRKVEVFSRLSIEWRFPFLSN